MKNEEFGCAMQACRKVILHSSFLVLHFDKLSFIIQMKFYYRLNSFPEDIQRNILIGRMNGI